MMKRYIKCLHWDKIFWEQEVGDDLSVCVLHKVPLIL